MWGRHLRTDGEYIYSYGRVLANMVGGVAVFESDPIYVVPYVESQATKRHRALAIAGCRAAGRAVIAARGASVFDATAQGEYLRENPI